MPKGPRGERRPADVIGAAIAVGRIATGDQTEELKLKSGRTRSGAAGGRARATAFLRKEQKQIATKAAAASWK